MQVSARRRTGWGPRSGRSSTIWPGRALVVRPGATSRSSQAPGITSRLARTPASTSLILAAGRCLQLRHVAGQLLVLLHQAPHLGLDAADKGVQFGHPGPQLAGQGSAPAVGARPLPPARGRL